MAAKQGHPKAQYNLAFCRLFGRGGDTNTEEAASLFLSAAQQGLMQAQYATGCCYMLGLGVKRDLPESGNKLAVMVQTRDHVSCTYVSLWHL
jgi:TPR repeat protein